MTSESMCFSLLAWILCRASRVRVFYREMIRICPASHFNFWIFLNYRVANELWCRDWGAARGLRRAGCAGRGAFNERPRAGTGPRSARSLARHTTLPPSTGCQLRVLFYPRFCIIFSLQPCMIALRYLSLILNVHASPHSSALVYLLFLSYKQFVQKPSKQFVLNNNQTIA